METQKIADLSLTVGEILLENGGENYRIEQSIHKICEAYGSLEEVVITSNGIFLSVKKDGDTVTTLKKVTRNSIDLYKVELVNAFSRKIATKPLPYETAKAILEDIQNAPTFTKRVRTFAAAMTGFTYTLFFNGSFLDSLMALIICLLTYLSFDALHMPVKFFEAYFSGVMISSLSLVSAHFLSGVNPHNVITGSIMILLPGVILTNGIKDSMYGNFSLGIISFLEAMFIITAVGLGIATPLALV